MSEASLPARILVVDSNRATRSETVRHLVDAGFGTEEAEDESLVVLHPDEFQLDVKDAIYELITVSLPVRVLHAPGECDEEMWALLQQYTVNPGPDEDDEDEWDEDDEDFDDEDFDDEDDSDDDDDQTDEEDSEDDTEEE